MPRFILNCHFCSTLRCSGPHNSDAEQTWKSHWKKKLHSSHGIDRILIMVSNFTLRMLITIVTMTSQLKMCQPHCCAHTFHPMKQIKCKSRAKKEADKDGKKHSADIYFIFFRRMGHNGGRRTISVFQCHRAKWMNRKTTIKLCRFFLLLGEPKTMYCSWIGEAVSGESCATENGFVFVAAIFFSSYFVW